MLNLTSATRGQSVRVELLESGVLRVTPEGAFDVSAMDGRIAPAVRSVPHDALLLDLSSTTLRMTDPAALVACWQDCMPARPCAILRSGPDGGASPNLFFRQVTQLLALAARPMLAVAFEATERAQAERWCQSLAVTFRFEAARARQT